MEQGLSVVREVVVKTKGQVKKVGKNSCHGFNCCKCRTGRRKGMSGMSGIVEVGLGANSC